MRGAAWAWSWALGVLSAAGCVRAADLTFPTAPPGTQTAVIAVSTRDPGTSTAVPRFADVLTWDGAPLWTPLALDADAELHVLYYPQVPGELDLDEGRVVAAAAETPSHPLATADAAWATTLADGDVWRPVTAAEQPPLLVPARSVEACAKQRGCWWAGACRTPCPPPSEPQGPDEVMVRQPPAVASCPSGWAERTSAHLGGSVCAPEPLPERADCPSGHSVFFGSLTCARVGRECPSGQWAPPPPGATVRYVLAGAPAGGDGSLGAPFGTVSAAVAAAPVGATLLLSRGVFAEDVVLDGRHDLHFEGACPEATSFVGVFDLERDAVASVSNVQFVGRAGEELLVVSWGTLSLAEVEVVGARIGIEVLGGATTVSRALVRDQVPMRGRTAAGIGVYDAGRLRATDVTSEGSAGQGVVAVLGTLDLERVIVRGSGAAGIVARSNVLSGTELLTVGALGAGIHVSDGARATLDTIAVFDTRAVDAFGGLMVDRGAMAEVSGALFEGNDTNVQLAETATVALTDALLIGGGTSTGGGSVEVRRSTLAVQRVALDGWGELGVVGAEAHLVGTDLGLHGCDVGALCQEALLLDDGETALARVTVHASGHHGALLQGGAAALSDVEVSEIRVTGDAAGDAALRAAAGAHLALTRATIAAPVVAVDLQGNAIGTVEHLVVRGSAGGALTVSGNASVTAARVNVAEVTGPGVLVGDPRLGRPSLTITDLRVVGATQGPDGIPAGLSLHGRATLVASRFVLADVAGPGVRVDGPGAEVSDGEITGCLVGIEALGAEVDLARLLGGVRIADDVPTPLIR